MSTLQSDGHIVVLERQQHTSFRSFISLLGLWQEMGNNSVLGRLLVGRPTFGDPNIQDYLEKSRIKIFIFLQFSVLLVSSLGTLISAITFLIMKQKIQKASCGHLIVCIYHLRFQMRDPGLYLHQGFLQSNLSFLPYPNILVFLQFSLLSSFGILKSLSKSSPLSGQQHTIR